MEILLIDVFLLLLESAQQILIAHLRIALLAKFHLAWTKLYQFKIGYKFFMLSRTEAFCVLIMCKIYQLFLHLIFYNHFHPNFPVKLNVIFYIIHLHFLEKISPARMKRTVFYCNNVFYRKDLCCFSHKNYVDQKCLHAQK